MRVRVLSTLAIALALLLVAEATLHVFGERIGEPQFWYAPDAQQLIEDMDRLEAAGIVSDVVFAGSSMVQFGIRSSIIEARLDSVTAAHNAGLPKGYTTVTRRWLLEEVAPRLQPARVIWGVSSIDFNGGRPTPAIVAYEEARAGARAWPLVHRRVRPTADLLRQRCRPAGAGHTCEGLFRLETEVEVVTTHGERAFCRGLCAAAAQVPAIASTGCTVDGAESRAAGRVWQ